jgi:hypothetical protein
VPNVIVPELSGDSLETTVDRATGLPVRVLERKQGALLRTVRVVGLRVDPELPAGIFRLAFPEGAEVIRSDEGFRRVELAEAAGVVGYDPLVPAWLPEGDRLAEVAVARRSGPTGTRGLPHLWARTESLVVTVGGDLGRGELVSVAESLRRS